MKIHLVTTRYEGQATTTTAEMREHMKQYSAVREAVRRTDEYEGFRESLQTMTTKQLIHWQVESSHDLPFSMPKHKMIDIILHRYVEAKVAEQE